MIGEVLRTFVNNEDLGLLPPLERRLARLDATNLSINVVHARGDRTPGVNSHPLITPSEKPVIAS